MLGQCRRRWANIEPTLLQRLTEVHQRAESPIIIHGSKNFGADWIARWSIRKHVQIQLVELGFKNLQILVQVIEVYFLSIFSERFLYIFYVDFGPNEIHFPLFSIQYMATSHLY